MHAHSPSERSSFNDIVELLKREVDRTLLRENLKLTVEQRLLKHDRVLQEVIALRGIMRLSGVPVASPE